jgi:hypothetical protein
VTNTTDLQAIFRDYLKEFLSHDLERRMERQSDGAVYAYWWEPGGKQTVVDADLWCIRNARQGLARALRKTARRRWGTMLRS